MPDRETVINHLKDCLEESRQDNLWLFVRKDIVEVAIVLLKEQEAVEPVKYSDNPMYLQCGNCGGWLLRCDKFCSNCGRAVKLDA